MIGSTLLRARIVLPIASPPIENGGVLISGNRIAQVGQWEHLAVPPKTDVHDLGEVVLLPGLINAHCHLDYTDMAGQFLPPKSFTGWIKLITTAKGGWTYSDFAQSWLNGARMLLRTGTTTVANFENVAELLPEIWNGTPLRVFSFLEMTGVKSRRDPKLILSSAVQKIDSFGVSPRGRPGLAPHAPYSTAPELIKLSAQTARKRGWLLTSHVGESLEEWDMFVHKSGAMFNWLKQNQRDMSDCGSGSPIQQLDRNGALGNNFLAVHANYLADGDAELLACSHSSVVHCPRSHDFFSHAPFPFTKLSATNVNICLGTDSLATIRKKRDQKLELNLFDEMRRFAKTYPETAPETILRMATINGAKALGMESELGQIHAGAIADLISVPFGGSVSDVYDALINFSEPISSSMIDGRWTMLPQM